MAATGKIDSVAGSLAGLVDLTTFAREFLAPIVDIVRLCPPLGADIFDSGPTPGQHRPNTGQKATTTGPTPSNNLPKPAHNLPKTKIFHSGRIYPLRRPINVRLIVRLPVVELQLFPNQVWHLQ